MARGVRAAVVAATLCATALGAGPAAGHRDGVVAAAAHAGSRRVLVQAFRGARAPAEVLVTNDVLRRFDTRCEHLVLTDNATAARLPAFVQSLRRRGVVVLELPSLLDDIKAEGIRVAPDIYASIVTGAPGTFKLGLFKAPTLSPGDVMVFLDSDAIPVGNIDSLFDYPTAAMPFWAVPDPHPTHQLNSGVMAVYVYDRLYEDFLKTLARVGFTVGGSANAVVNYHVNLNVPFPRTMLPGLYGAHAPSVFDGHRYGNGFGFRMRNAVVGTRTRHWHDYLQVVQYGPAGGLDVECRLASTKRHHRRGFPATYILRRHCCALAAALRESEREAGDAPNDKVSKRTFAADGYCAYFSKEMAKGDSENPQVGWERDVTGP